MESAEDWENFQNWGMDVFRTNHGGKKGGRGKIGQSIYND